MAGPAGAFATRLATRFVAFDERTTEQTIEGWHLPQELASAQAQSNRSRFAQLGAHECQSTYITGLLTRFLGQSVSFVNPSRVDTLGERDSGALTVAPNPAASRHSIVLVIHRVGMDQPSWSILERHRRCRAPVLGE